MSDMCMVCRTVVSNNWIQCPKCKCVRCVPVAEKSSDTDIPIKSQKPPFQSEPFPGYFESLKERIVELEATVQEACNLLNDCLEWDNGGECAYEKIVEFINKHDREVGGKP